MSSKSGRSVDFLTELQQVAVVVEDGELPHAVVEVLHGVADARDPEGELRLQAPLQHDLPFEPELDRWFPLWDAPLDN